MRLYEKAQALLEQLIQIPSLSREEKGTADHIEAFFHREGMPTQRKGHNIWAKNTHYDPNKPSILLNSHHDTVKPVSGWIRDPFSATIEGDKLYGLGSNDAGGPLVALIAAFLHMYHRKDLTYNLVLAATAEEEISGSGGIASILPEIGPLWAGIVGEPTSLKAAIAEKGLLVLDAVLKGKSGHAARQEGINAIYLALPAIEWFQNYRFEKVSPLLGPVKMSVTQIEAGTQHNVVPDLCRFVVDIRTNECYSNPEVLALIQSLAPCEVQARSLRLNSSFIPQSHPLLKACMNLGINTFGSPTLSDQALMPFPTLKLGPGDSARSHTADEYIGLEELRLGIELYIKILERFQIEE